MGEELKMHDIVIVVVVVVVVWNESFLPSS